jgi:hypothetical protein
MLLTVGTAAMKPADTILTNTCLVPRHAILFHILGTITFHITNLELANDMSKILHFLGGKG